MKTPDASNRYVTRRRASTVCTIFALLATGIGTAHEEAPASPGTTPYVVLISIDGFRHDYLDRFPAPALQHIAREGVRAESLRPVWPTLTFPNHYSIATGLYPAEHGIVGNRFPAPDRSDWYSYRKRESVQNGKWYGGEPVWVAAERAGFGSAAFYFVGTEAPVGDVSPSDWRPFDDDVSGDTRIDQALEWLARPAENRPHVVTLYFEHVDVASHRHGPGSAQVAAAIRTVDAWLARLQAGIATLPVADQVHVVVVSDHGQAFTRRDATPLVLDEHIDLEGMAAVVHGSVAMLYLDKRDPLRARELRDAINANWRHGRAWLPDEAPRYWRVGGNDAVADVLVQPDPGYVVIASGRESHALTTGDHGWSPGFRDMHGIFLARGPALPSGVTTGTVNAVDIYPLLMAILGLPDDREGDARSPLLDLLK